MSGDDQDDANPFLTLPLAVIRRRVDDAMPAGVRASKATYEAINACCTHLIQTVASEANRQSMRASKRTVSGEHVEQAIELILPEFLEEGLSESKRTASGRKGASAEGSGGAEPGEKKRKKKRKKLTKEEEEELAREQEALFQGLVMPST